MCSSDLGGGADVDAAHLEPVHTAQEGGALVVQQRIDPGAHPGGEEGDGVVPVRQQLTLKLQDEAVSITGYEAGHAKVLSHEDFLERFPALINSL